MVLNSSLNLPETQTIINNSRTDVKALIPESNPFDPAGLVNAFIVAPSNRQREIYDQLLIIQRNTFATTATDEALLDKGTVYGFSLLDPTQAQGFITITGVSSTVVPIATEFQSSSSEKYTTLTSVTLNDVDASVATLTRSGNTVSVVTSSDHSISTGMEIAISGANEVDYNGSFTVTVTATDKFTYTISTTPATPATGTIFASYVGAPVEVLSSNTGQVTNVDGGNSLTLTTTIAGVDNTVNVQFNGVDGGTDTETFEEFRARLLQRIQNPFTPFNNATIEAYSKQIAGVTRTFIFNPNDINTSDTPASISNIGTDLAKITFSSAHGLLSGMLE